MSAGIARAGMSVCDVLIITVEHKGKGLIITPLPAGASAGLTDLIRALLEPA